jgi:hypothetical protein
MTAAATPLSLPRSPWIVSSRYDAFFFAGSLALPLVLWAAFSYGLVTGVAVFAIFQLAFNMPHNFQTWTMSVFDADDRQKHGRRYLVALVVILAIFGLSIVLAPTTIFPVVRDALVYWGYYHLVRQHYGLLRLYERRMAASGTPAPPLEGKLYSRYVEIVSYAPLLLRFRDPELMTIHAGDVSIWIRHPILPPWAWHAVAVVYGAAIAAAVVAHVVAFARGRTEVLPRALLLLAITLCFGLAAIAIRDIVVAIAVVTSFHNLQYLGLVWFHNRTRAEIAERENAPRGANAPIDWLRSDKVPLYLACTFGYGLVLVAPIAIFPGKPLAELPITAMVALHYYVDSRVWRFGERPGLARFLRLKP